MGTGDRCAGAGGGRRGVRVLPARLVEAVEAGERDLEGATRHGGRDADGRAGETDGALEHGHRVGQLEWVHVRPPCRGLRQCPAAGRPNRVARYVSDRISAMRLRSSSRASSNSTAEWFSARSAPSRNTVG